MPRLLGKHKRLKLAQRVTQMGHERVVIAALECKALTIGEEIERLKIKGLSVTSVANEFGVSEAWVKLYIKNLTTGAGNE